MPKFVKKETELETDMDQWLYLLKHISQMNQIPTFLDKRIFRLIFSIGEVAKLKEEDLMSYEASLKRKMDTRSVLETARRAGLAEGKMVGLAEGKMAGLVEGKMACLAEGKMAGLAEGKMAGLAEGERKKAIETAIEMKKDGIPYARIIKYTKLTIEEIEKL